MYTAATAVVLWGAATGRLVAWRDLPWPILASAAAGVATYAAYTVWFVVKPLTPGVVSDREP